MTARETVESFGWWVYKSCSCGGVFTLKCKHPNKPSVEIWLRPNRNQWLHKLNGRLQEQGIIESLKQKLEKL